MDRLLKTVWTNSPQTEAERVVQVLAVLRQGFYQQHNFVVLPQLVEGVDPNAQVVLPRLEYEKVEDLWGRVPVWRIDKWMAGTNKLLLEEILQLLPREKLRGRTPKLEREWGRVESRFWQEVEAVLPGTVEYFGEIEVRVTRYGTIASGVIPSKVGQRVIYYLRSDQGLEQLAAMMVNDALGIHKDELGITWSKREALMDFVMTRPTMKKLFPKFDPVMHQLSRVPVAVRERSERYLRDLGVPRQERELAMMGNKLLVKGKSAKGVLTKEEEKVLKLLVRNAGELVTYDQLADLKWGEGEFHTFWAINRQVGRIRDKLERAGIGGVTIAPVRGQGYILQ